MDEKALPAVEIDTKGLTDEGEFEGYASIFNQKDQVDDIVVPGAFSGSLKARATQKVKMLWQHDPAKLIGKWLELREDNRGLYVKGKLFRNMADGQMTYELMKEGVLDSLSIGYRTLKRDFRDGIRYLQEVDLKEISVVTFPALETARISGVKSDLDLSPADIERVLRDAGMSRNFAKCLVNHGLQEAKSRFSNALRDADDGNDAAELLEIQRLLGDFSKTITA